ncbi:MAG: zeta toxin family protein [Parvularculaceae bacterium]
MSHGPARPTLFVIAGPNGAGKTTFYETALKGKIAAPFINADIIQREELGEADESAAYKAADIAAQRRSDLLNRRESFVTESVFSHPSKLEMLREAKARGFRIVVFHLHVSSADLAVARVEERVKEGGHPVPVRKIRERFDRNQELIRAGVAMGDQAMVYDASGLNRPPKLLMRTRSGKAEITAIDLPNWFRDLYLRQSAQYSGTRDVRRNPAQRGSEP